VDALSGLLDGPRARDAFLLRAVMRPPWCIRVQDEAPLSLIALTRGSAWIMLDDGSEPTLLHTGDLAVMRGPDHYTMADDPATPIQIVVHPGELCTTPDGVSTTETMTLGVRSWGNDPDGPVTMLIGVYTVGGAVGRRLVDALPTLAVVRHDDWSSPLLGLLGEEIVKDEPGQDLVLDRLLDLLLVAVLRAWFSRPEAAAPAWYQAHGDPVVGTALRHLHNDPARPWTVASLAAATGVSRAALARRFTELVGEPPMTFLTGWRLALAADLLREPGATVAGVARQVGYATPFALSAAFKRVTWASPREFRERAATG
jgi:AraC-like DNA-binding protein